MRAFSSLAAPCRVLLISDCDRVTEINSATWSWSVWQWNLIIAFTKVLIRFSANGYFSTSLLPFSPPNGQNDCVDWMVEQTRTILPCCKLTREYSFVENCIQTFRAQSWTNLCFCSKVKILKLNFAGFFVWLYFVSFFALSILLDGWEQRGQSKGSFIIVSNVQAKYVPLQPEAKD